MTAHQQAETIMQSRKVMSSLDSAIEYRVDLGLEVHYAHMSPTARMYEAAMHTAAAALAIAMVSY